MISLKHIKIPKHDQSLGKKVLTAKLISGSQTLFVVHQRRIIEHKDCFVIDFVEQTDGEFDPNWVTRHIFRVDIVTENGHVLSHRLNNDPKKPNLNDLGPAFPLRSNLVVEWDGTENDLFITGGTCSILNRWCGAHFSL